MLMVTLRSKHLVICSKFLVDVVDVGEVGLNVL